MKIQKQIFCKIYNIWGNCQIVTRTFFKNFYLNSLGGAGGGVYDYDDLVEYEYGNAIDCLGNTSFNFIRKEIEDCFYLKFCNSYFKKFDKYYYNGRKLTNYNLYLGSLLPILKINEVEKLLNIKIESDYIELFSFPQNAPNAKEQEILKQRLNNKDIIWINKSIAHHYVFYDKITNKKYCLEKCNFDNFSNKYINKY